MECKFPAQIINKVKRYHNRQNSCELYHKVLNSLILQIRENQFFLSPWFFFSFIFISWRLINLQYCSGFCHTLTWISRGLTCVPHPDPLSCLPLHPIPLGLPSTPALRTSLLLPTWTGDMFHPWVYTCFNDILSEHPTLTFSHRV